MSQAGPRVLVHTREVVCRGYRRPDGLWDIEAHMADRKEYTVHSDYRCVETGEPFHDMALSVTVDGSLTIQAVEASIAAAPHRICPAIVPNFQRLVGLRIASGFTLELRRRLGGVEGCTHLVELFGSLATTAVQTVQPLLSGDGHALAERPRQIGACHALAATGEVVAKYWPGFHVPRG